MDRIKIELDSWEDAVCPICTKDVNLNDAEQMLYGTMKNWYGYSDKDIEKYLNGEGDNDKVEKFMSQLCKEEEDVVLKCGGVYYEDMADSFTA